MGRADGEVTLLWTLPVALIAWSVRRMSVSRAFAWACLVRYALSTLPGMRFLGIGLTVGVMRPGRDPERPSRRAAGPTQNIDMQ